MTVAELIAELQKLPPGAEIAVFAAHAFPRPPVIHKVNPWAFVVDSSGQAAKRFTGFIDPQNAYLLRPSPETI